MGHPVVEKEEKGGGIYAFAQWPQFACVLGTRKPQTEHRRATTAPFFGRGKEKVALSRSGKSTADSAFMEKLNKLNVLTLPTI